MRRWTGFLAAGLFVTLFLLLLGRTAWTVCNKGVFFCDVDNGVDGGTSSVDKNGVFGYHNGGGAGVRGYTSSTPEYPFAGVEGANDGAGPGVTGAGVLGPGVRGYSSQGSGIYGLSNTGSAGYFEVTNAANANWALLGKNLSGSGVYGQGKRTGVYGTGNTYGVHGASAGGLGGFFDNTSAGTGTSALKAQTAGLGYAAEFRATNSLAKGGIYIKTNGAKGIVVEGGTKNAVVDTSKGKRALYAEEASEVYFTDYGFGKLKDGRALITIDPLFAETVNLRQPYHVFTQAYGQAELIVTKRTPSAFEVSLRDKDTQGDVNAEFSYRLVARRQGFETARLEAVSAPTDCESGPGAEKPVAKVAAFDASPSGRD